MYAEERQFSPVSLPCFSHFLGKLQDMATRKKAKRDDGTGSLYPDGAGYRVQVMLERNGKRRPIKRRAKTHEEAVRILNQLIAESHNGTLSMPLEDSFGVFMQSWLEVWIRPNRSEATFEQYQWIINNHVLPTLGRRRLNQLTSDELQRLLNAKARQPVMSRTKTPEPTDRLLSPNTLRLIRAVLHSALEEAVRSRLLATNPADGLKLPKSRATERIHLTSEEITRLYHSTDTSAVGLMIRFMLLTGVRLGEATGVRWRDIDLESGRVNICGQVLKPRRGPMKRSEETKTGQTRSIVVTDPLLSELRAIKASSPSEQLPECLVFLGDRGLPLQPTFVRDALRRFCDSAGVKRVHPHALRHSAATAALGAGVDIHAVSKMLGHKQISLTADLYGHESLNSMTRIAEVMSGVVRTNPPS